MARHANHDDNAPPRGMMQMMEKAMRGMTGATKGDIHARAQELALDAMSAGSEADRIRMAIHAAVLDPQCTDAFIILSDFIDDPDELIEVLQLLVQRAADVLGAKYFEEQKGDFWGILETRPYMRARKELAGALDVQGKSREAIAEFEGMLELNPNDNQAVRYRLLTLYFITNNLDPAEALFSRYAEEGGAQFLWLRLLLEIIRGNDAAAETFLQKAREGNRHVEGYLTGKKRMPEQMPEYYRYGEVSEAIIAANDIKEAWSMHPKAVQWLSQREVPKERKGKH